MGTKPSLKDYILRVSVETLITGCLVFGGWVWFASDFINTTKASTCDHQARIVKLEKIAETTLDKINQNQIEMLKEIQGVKSDVTVTRTNVEWLMKSADKGQN
jgi:hypothetical protein